MGYKRVDLIKNNQNKVIEIEIRKGQINNTVIIFENKEYSLDWKIK